jgi:hypothetical protein
MQNHAGRFAQSTYRACHKVTKDETRGNDSIVKGYVQKAILQQKLHKLDRAAGNLGQLVLLQQHPRCVGCLQIPANRAWLRINSGYNRVGINQEVEPIRNRTGSIVVSIVGVFGSEGGKKAADARCRDVWTCLTRWRACFLSSASLIRPSSSAIRRTPSSHGNDLSDPFAATTAFQSSRHGVNLQYSTAAHLSR